MTTTEFKPTNQVETFLSRSGLLRDMTLDALVIGLRHKLAADGAVCCVRRDTRLRLRAMLAGRWHWSDAERIESRIIGAILSMNPYARIQGVSIRKRGCYVEAEIGII